MGNYLCWLSSTLHGSGIDMNAVDMDAMNADAIENIRVMKYLFVFVLSIVKYLYLLF